jgi:hypothetical protein
MTFRVGTYDGTVVIVDEADLELITAYLVLRGYPPVSVVATDVPPSDPRDMPVEL